MKKIYILPLVLVLVSLNLYSQTIVSTTPENKKVVLEEYTGIHCVYCPDGHAIAQSILDANPGNAFAINVHTGSYASPGAGEPDFRTSFGSALAGQTGLTGYPSGTVNRHVFSGSNTALSRSAWTSSANTIMGQSSYVNVGVEATIDVATRELTVHVEAYYTGNSPQSTNKLNVAILQNNVEGPQTGGSTYNPSQVLPNGNYNHMHMLRHLVTGQWGDDITTTTSGSFVDRTYNYTLPADINGVTLDMSNLEIVAFVAEGQQEIISGNECIPTYTGFIYSTNASLINVTTPAAVCGSLEPDISFQNFGSNDITSIDFSYSVNGGTASTYNWTGTLVPASSATITLPSIAFTSQPTNTVDVQVVNVNGAPDEDATDNNASTNFNLATEASTVVYLDLLTDNYGSETSWDLFDATGTSVYSGSGYGNNQQINETFNLSSGCYNFVIEDSYGDGICCSYGNGHYILTDDNSTTIFSGGQFGSIEETPFRSVVSSNIVVGDKIEVAIYPNPTNGIVNITNLENANITVVNILGEVVAERSNANGKVAIDLSEYANGTYSIKITSNNNSVTRKFILQK